MSTAAESRSSSAVASRTAVWPLVAAVLATVELIIVYAPTAAWLWSRWTENVWEHAHGLLIVPVVGYFVWQELRGRVAQMQPTAWGFLWLVAGLALHVLDAGMHTQLLSAASLLLVLPGLVLLTAGSRVLRTIAFPFSLLVFALPIPLSFTEQIHLVLRQFVTSVIAGALPLVGVSAYVEQTTIQLASGSVEIADACSGFTTLYASLVVALLTAYTTQSPRRRVLVLVSAIPLAIAANLLRIFMLVLLVEWQGPEILQTSIHPLSGVMTFALALPIIFWLGSDPKQSSRPAVA